MKKYCSIAALVLMASVSFARAETASVINQPADGWFILGGLSNKVVKDDGAEGGKATEVKVDGEGGPWGAGALNKIVGKINKGDRIVVKLKFRIETAGGSPGSVNARVEFGGEPWTTYGEQALVAGPEWTEKEFQFTAPDNCAAGACSLTVHLNTAKQTIYLGSGVVVNKGPG